MDWIPVGLIVFKGTVLFVGMFLAIKWHYDQDKKIGRENGEPQSSTELRLFVTMLLALGLSLIGIVYAGCWGNAAYGGIGGALGCALAVAMFILCRPDGGLGRGDVPAEPDPATLNESLDQLARLRRQTEHLRAAFAVSVQSAEREKIYVAIALVISVLAWKFGDIPATWLNAGF
jgi:hypothetical protein